MGAQERLSFQEASAKTLIATEHVHRYALAARLCAGLRVVDLACGTGYGSAILRESATSVLGVDNDPATVEAASATVGRDHDVSFETADALEFVSRDLSGTCDAIVCFEGLEHVPDPEAVLTQLERHAEAGLKLIVSVPNSKAFEEENEFHVTDYGYEEARVAFDRFDEVTVLYQFLAEGSLMRGRAPSKLDADFVLEEHGELEWANHFIACVNLDEALSEVGDSSHMHLAVAPLYNRWGRSLEQANRDMFQEARSLEDKVRSLEQANREMSERASSLERANREMFRENARIARERIGMADSAAATMSERVEFLQQRVNYLEYLLDKPRHQAIERARDRVARLPALDRVARFLGKLLSRN